MAFCAAATVVADSAAATAAARGIVKRMSPPSNRYTCDKPHNAPSPVGHFAGATGLARTVWFHGSRGSEEHTSELQSQSKIVCRLLLLKKKKKDIVNEYTKQ